MENGMNTVKDFNTIIIGSGAAGYAAANDLFECGVTDIAIVTEGVRIGTSRNAGSDKQTYYKLSLAGNKQDSIYNLATDLFHGGCVDGDQALCEAALSTQCFYLLVQLGVPFPKNRYGEYIGYKTDHDPNKRATSAGPYTSKLMTEQLEKAVLQKGIPVQDHLMIVQLLQQKDKIAGIVCLDLEKSSQRKIEYITFLCENIIYATGGPAGIYQNNVYPYGHHGMTGVALMAGVKAQNVTEWQFGIASLHPKWNISGSYMQVMPRFVSTDVNLTDEREFLNDYFCSKEEMLSLIFLKGYQWPFDVKKLDGSSIIDILVYIETVLKGRRVFLDFTSNSLNQDIDFAKLTSEAYDYLTQAGICYGTPYERLEKLNLPAIDYFNDHKVDFSQDLLEIAICAQHNNGGLAVDCWWQTNIEGLFVVGEAAGTHGVCRPGGTALNAGQVGALRAAQYIAQKWVNLRHII